MSNSDITLNTSQTDRGLSLDQPAGYCIRVVGYLDKNWSDRLGGLTITSAPHSGRKDITTLSGVVIDQAALFGVLKALYDMRLPLLSVECLGTTKGVNP